MLKDLKENGLLTYILAETNDEREESLDILKFDNCSLTPLIELQFNKNNINYDLNKKELKETLTSNILLNFFKNNLSNFIPEIQKKIKKDDDLKQYIELYLDNYNIYFCGMPNNINAITIHTGNIYLASRRGERWFSYEQAGSGAVHIDR